MLEGFTQFVEQPRILDCDNRLSGEVRKQRNLFVCKRTDLLVVNGDCANKPSVIARIGIVFGWLRDW